MLLTYKELALKRKISDTLLNYYLKNDQLKVDVLNKFVSLGLSPKEAAEKLNIPTYKAHRFLRYGVNILTQSQRRGIKERDKYKCRNCGVSSKDALLHVHHKGDPKNNSPRNLITLCNACHRREDARLKKLKK